MGDADQDILRTNMTIAFLSAGYAKNIKNIAISSMAVTVALTAALIASAPSASASPSEFEKGAFASYQPDLKNGEYMFNAAGCAACHGSAANSKLLSGGLKMRSAIGTFSVPNITASSQGIGGWSNADFLNAVMIGVKPDGSYIYPVMPFTAYAGMKPQDVLDIMAYIKTLPKSDARSGANEISFPYNQQFMVALWRRANFTTKPFQPVRASQRERGRYLVENVAACGQCHSGRTFSFGLDPSKAYAGEKGLTGEYAPAIDAKRLASIAKPAAFVDGVLVKGLKLNGSPIAAGSMKRITEGTAKLTEKDRTAMLAYLEKKKSSCSRRSRFPLAPRTRCPSSRGRATSPPRRTTSSGTIAAPVTVRARARKAASPPATCRRSPPIRPT